MKTDFLILVSEPNGKKIINTKTNTEYDSHIHLVIGMSNEEFSLNEWLAGTGDSETHNEEMTPKIVYGYVL